ncbi:MAG: glutamine amidotransferase-related protein [Gammaproteobacteria bacterium]
MLGICYGMQALVLTLGGRVEGAEVGAAPLSGYLIVWAICSGTALVAALSLLVVPRGAFAD